MEKKIYTLEDFHFDLPKSLIAQAPALDRTASRLLYLPPQDEGEHPVFFDRQFNDFQGLLDAGDLLVFNDTRVIKARFFGQKESGGKIEVLLERILNQDEVVAQIRASKAPKAGSRLIFADGFSATVLGRSGAESAFFHLRRMATKEGDLDWWQFAESHGQIPLPPYITHPATPEDTKRYQTVYARNPGAVAAPTAGLHFDDHMMAALKNKGIEIAFLTLHVGAGTYQPLRVEKIADHQMHHEVFFIPEETVHAIHAARHRRRRVIAIGTTSLRALESAADGKGGIKAGGGETDIFITPGHHFQVVDALLTNFHLPRSTLLMLVSAFAGVSCIRAAYAHAILKNYRFFSYGDAMFLAAPRKHDTL